jgi:hypothetical protein
MPWEFVWLIATAVAYHYVKPYMLPLLVLAAIVGFFTAAINAWLYLAARFPKTMFVIAALLRRTPTIVASDIQNVICSLGRLPKAKGASPHQDVAYI